MADGDDKDGMLEGLEDVRARLDDVDGRIVSALSERDAIVLEVAKRKQESGADRVRDPRREEALIARLVQQGIAAGLDGYFVTRLYREIIDHSVRMQERYLSTATAGEGGEGPLRVAYQGVEGAYSQLAAMRHFGPHGANVVFVGHPSFRAMMESVRDGDALYGMLPVENTTAGSINDAYDLLARMDLHVVGEEVHKVEHCLVTIDAVPLSRIRRVFSHPQALAQCSDFLSQLEDCHVEAFHDTAGAVEKVALEGDLSQAAIASDEAARRYGLTVIKRGIANQRENYTRFMVVAREAIEPDGRVPSKTSLLLTTKHEEGALLGCLSVLARRHLNLTKLESRPRPRTPWEYMFYVDFEGSTASENVREALEELRVHTSFLRVLGSYPARTRPGAAQGAAQVAAVRSAPQPSAKRAQVVDLERLPLRLTSRRSHPDDTCIELGQGKLGEGAPKIIVESPEPLCGAKAQQWASAMAREGVDALRVAWQALSDADVEEMARSTGLPIAIEVDHPEQVERAVLRGDALVASAAQMQNDALLRELGRVDRPVWVERNPLASLEEWMAAAEYVLERGNHRVALLERGARSFDQSLERALDVSAIASLRERCHLPVLVDPCAATGRGRWAVSLGMGALWAGAQGLCVRVDPAGTDGGSLDLDGLRALLSGRAMQPT